MDCAVKLVDTLAATVVTRLVTDLRRSAAEVSAVATIEIATAMRTAWRQDRKRLLRFITVQILANSGPRGFSTDSFLQRPTASTVAEDFACSETISRK